MKLELCLLRSNFTTRVVIMSFLLLFSGCKNNITKTDGNTLATKQQTIATKPLPKKATPKQPATKPEQNKNNSGRKTIPVPPAHTQTKAKAPQSQKRVSPKKPTTNRASIKSKPRSLPPRKPLKPIPMKLPTRQRLSGTAVKLPVKKQRAIENSIQRVIPPETKINTVVHVIQKPALKHPTIIVSHLLDGRSANDTDYRIRSEYASHKKITELSQQRSFEILKSVLANAAQHKSSELIVNISHGVRPYTKNNAGERIYSAPYAYNFYSTSINIERIPAAKWRSMGLNAFSQNWEVEHNTISTLEFSK